MLTKLEPYIETYTGAKFYFLNPDQKDIHVEDIAHALANNCRYTGHCSEFYSVAEHSVIVSLLVDPANALAGLFHDGSEAYLTDVASPVKPFLANYRDMEHTIMVAIAKKFGFDYPLNENVEDADKVQLKTEAKYLMQSQGKDWAQHYPTKIEHGKIPRCLSPQQAKALFLQRYHELTPKSLIMAA